MGTKLHSIGLLAPSTAGNICTPVAPMAVSLKKVFHSKYLEIVIKQRNQINKRKTIESEGVADQPDPFLKILNQYFTLVEGLDKVRRGRGLGRIRHYLLFPMPLLI